MADDGPQDWVASTRVSANSDENRVVDGSSLHSAMAAGSRRIEVACSYQYHRQQQSMHNWKQNVHAFGCLLDDQTNNR